MANVIVKKQFTSDTSDVIKVSSDAGGVVKSTTSGDPAGTINITTNLTGTNINDLGDVDTSNLVDESILLWNASTSKYVATPWGSMTIDGGQIT
tara:strand:+ start:959 stop:1240 length:282 start_codon:yes stop_codon:yes gene_type:complete